METFEDDNPKNLYVIRRKLGAITPDANGEWIYYVGHFIVHITPNDHQGPVGPEKCILSYQRLNVHLYEKMRSNFDSIYMPHDVRFMDYQSIMYDVFHGPNGPLNLSDGRDMPITHLCELIKYLYRLSNLTAFS